MRAAFFLAALCAAQESPFNTAADLDNGARLYRANCGVCHGLDGKGSRGPDLTTGKFRHGGRDEDLFRSINDGIKGTEMPPIWLEGRQTWQIIAYLRSLAARPRAESGAGDPVQGRAIFEGKGGCLACHRVGDAGSRTGPDLSDAGARFSRADLERDILRPGERVAPRNWYIRAEHRDGRTIRGRRLNEDTYSVQLIDADERLIGLVKADLKSYRIVKESPMPSYQGKLTAAETANLVAWLASLR